MLCFTKKISGNRKHQGLFKHKIIENGQKEIQLLIMDLFNCAQWNFSMTSFIFWGPLTVRPNIQFARSHNLAGP